MSNSEESAGDFPDIRPDHIGVSVPDIEASIAWYGKMFGFELEKKEFIAFIPAYVAFLRKGNFRIELFQVEGAAALPPERREPNLDLRTHGNKHVCYAVSDVRGTVQTLRERGADIVFEKVIQGTPMAFLRDNAGNLIELLQPDAALNKQVPLEKLQ